MVLFLSGEYHGNTASYNRLRIWMFNGQNDGWISDSNWNLVQDINFDQTNFIISCSQDAEYICGGSDNVSIVKIYKKVEDQNQWNHIQKLTLIIY